MTVQLSPCPKFQGIGFGGLPVPFGKLYTYKAGTNIAQATYTDATQTQQNLNPVVLDGNASANVWTDVTLTYKFKLTDALGNQIYIVDQIPGGITAAQIIAVFTQSIVGSILWPQTAAETNAGITAVLNYTYGDIRRYGVLPNDPTLALGNATLLQATFNAAITNGPTGNFWFPNLTGADTYYFGGIMVCRPGIYLDLQGCTLNYSAIGVGPIDNDSGLFVASRDFSIKNGVINTNCNTGTASGFGGALQLGVRSSGTQRWPFNPVYDAALSHTQGNIRVENLRINCVITGTPITGGSAAIAMTGGLHNVVISNVKIGGTGDLGLGQGISYEFGFATPPSVGDTGNSTQQTSHMRDAFFSNIDIQDLDTTDPGSGGIILSGAYNTIVDNYYFNGISNGFVASPGEAMFFYPWVGQDDIGSKRTIQLRNITGEFFSQQGLNLQGIVARVANSGFRQLAWIASTPYVFNMTVINGGNMYICVVPGTSASSGGPTGTGNTITDGTVTWNYVPLTANTDLLDFSLDGFAFSNGNLGSAGIFTSAGKALIKNGFILGSSTGIANAIVFEDSCTIFEIDAVSAIGVAQIGFQLGSGLAPIWSPTRPKRGVIKNCFIAGNGSSSAGIYVAINLANCDGVSIEECRFGHETAYDGLNETTSGGAVFLPNTANSLNVKIKNCRVGGAVGGIAISTSATTAFSFGSIVENCTFNGSGTNPITTPIQGFLMSDITSPVQAIASSGTVGAGSNAIYNTFRCTPAAAVTGIIMPIGLYQGQQVTVINESIAANTITMDVAGTSVVADGTSCVIAGLTQKTLRWDTGTSLWYHS